ncbi:MAG: glutathione S-transferase family protein [Rhodospirillales bacterium]|nr:glutathione S-transferase family protein [Rhodospirillales bacterium]
MLTLYHYWRSVCSQKVRLCLIEKGVAWENRHVDIFKFEHLEPDYLRLNPNGVVPTLVDDGTVFIESTVINEYIDDAFPGAALAPAEPHARGLMRLWVKKSDEVAHPGVAVASYRVRHKPRLAGVPKDALLAQARRQPTAAKRAQAVSRIEHGVPEAEEEMAYTRLDELLDQMEAALVDGPWLLGGTYSLADIALAPYINRVEVLDRPEMLRPDLRPRLADWWARMQARPAYAEAFSFANPDPTDPIAR